MKLDIKGDKILLVGNRGHKNMGDEIILVGNMKLLLKQGKKLFIACSDKKWLKKFHKQFLADIGNFKENEQGFYDIDLNKQVITYVYELPKGFRSFFRLIKNISDLKKMFQADAILIGGGEILTEETAYSYLYWFLSVWIFLFTKKLYLSGGIQIPKKFGNKLIYNILIKKSEKIYVRDYEQIGDLGIKLKQKAKSKNLKFKVIAEDLSEDLQKITKGGEKMENNSINPDVKFIFFPDTSLFTVLGNKDYQIDEIKYKWYYLGKIKKDKSIIVNINKKAEQFYEKIESIIEQYYKQDYTIYFARICKSPADDDIIYYYKLKKKYDGIKLLDWEDFYSFLKILLSSQKVYTTRLHLFLISYYLDLELVPFVYQKKVEKMKKVLNFTGKS